MVPLTQHYQSILEKSRIGGQYNNTMWSNPPPECNERKRVQICQSLFLKEIGMCLSPGELKAQAIELKHTNCYINIQTWETLVRSVFI